MSYSLKISGIHHESLRQHLFPGDGLEAVAFGLCGRNRTDSGQILTVHKLVLIPHGDCERTAVSVTWRTVALAAILDETRRGGFALVKFHSHPTGYDQFSRIDDISDAECFGAISSWLDNDEPHGSAVMLPDGSMFGRVSTDSWDPFSAVSVAGTDLSFWYSTPNDPIDMAEELAAQIQLFGSGTISRLRRLTIGVVGCSGTGSFVIELLARLGGGKLVLVDGDKIENRNLNRIVNSRSGDVGEYKAKVLKREIESFGLGTIVEAVPHNLFHPEAVATVSRCDVVFGCVDTAEGRHLLGKIAAFHLIPYFDLGVHLNADGKGGIDEASGVVHYFQPGGSTLLDRKAYTMEQVRVEGLYRTSPEQYEAEIRAGYIKGVAVRSPAVASLNSSISSIAVNEFLARLHPFRSCDSEDCEIIRFNFMETLIFKESAQRLESAPEPFIGRGEIDPPLNMPVLSRKVSA